MRTYANNIETVTGKKKKLAFCITCMNRLSHIQQTLVKNMKDNFLPDEVEFILLDYNSTDGLEEWVKTLQNYIDIGILHYYRTDIPANYHRSHSRNTAFRLAYANIICNLDADNFLGKGFAEYILDEFEKHRNERIFITSSGHSRDVFGRICVRTDDFYHINGYNEMLAMYGFEDLELFDRLLQLGLQQKIFWNEAFFEAISHSYVERIVNEWRYKQLDCLYLAYKSPYEVQFLILYKNGMYESGSLINNQLCNFNHNKKYANMIDRAYDSNNRVMLCSPLIRAKWTLKNDEMLTVNDSVYYKIRDREIIAEFISRLSGADNFKNSREIKNKQGVVNPTGFGQGIVYKNFDYTNPIKLD